MAPKHEKHSLHSEQRALRAELNALRDLMDERDRRYCGERKAERRETVAALTASKEAMLKAEDSQRIYNQTHNELQRKMDAQHKETMPRDVAEIRFKALEENVAGLRESRSGLTGREDAIKQLADVSRRTHQWMIGLTASVILSVIGLVLAFLLRGA